MNLDLAFIFDHIQYASVCYNLNVNSYYEVTKTRGKEHKCFVHPGDKVFTVEVTEKKRTIMLPKKIAKEGAIVTYKHTKCDKIVADIPKVANTALFQGGNELKNRSFLVKIIRD